MKGEGRIDLIHALKKFSANTIEKHSLTAAVKVELLDLELSPLYEMVATGKDNGGTWVFSNDRAIVGTLSRPTPYRVQFTTEEKKPFVLDFPQG